MHVIAKIVLLITVSAFLFGEKLMNMETGSIVVEFRDGNVRFSDCFLELELQQNGIYIPSSMKPGFDNKEIVYMSDPMFEKAFLEVYYPLCIANSLYQWQD
jgi:hypothetical protein